MKSTSSEVHETCFNARGLDLHGLIAAQVKDYPPGRSVASPLMQSDSVYGTRSKDHESLQNDLASQGISTFEDPLHLKATG